MREIHGFGCFISFKSILNYSSVWKMIQLHWFDRYQWDVKERTHFDFVAVKRTYILLFHFQNFTITDNVIADSGLVSASQHTCCWSKPSGSHLLSVANKICMENWFFPIFRSTDKRYVLLRLTDEFKMLHSIYYCWSLFNFIFHRMIKTVTQQMRMQRSKVHVNLRRSCISISFNERK